MTSALPTELSTDESAEEDSNLRHPVSLSEVSLIYASLSSLNDRRDKNVRIKITGTAGAITAASRLPKPSIKAPQAGFEPTTGRLTADCSAIELLRNKPCPQGTGSVIQAGYQRIELCTSGFGDHLGSQTVPYNPEGLITIVYMRQARLYIMDKLIHAIGKPRRNRSQQKSQKHAEQNLVQAVAAAPMSNEKRYQQYQNDDAYAKTEHSCLLL